MTNKKPLTAAEIRALEIEQFVANAKPKDKGLGGHVKDSALSLLSGAVSVPEAAVGVADLVTGGRAGKFLENEDGAVGFRPKEAHEAINSWKTEGAQKQLKQFQNTEGLGGKFGYALKNPSMITNAALESLPAMGAGGVVGRGLGLAAKGIKPVAAAAIGEGVVGAGMTAEAIRQETPDGLLTPKQSALAGASGVTTGGFGYLGGRAAQKLGIADPDTMFTAGNRFAGGVNGAGNVPQRNIAARTAGGALSEGVFEELPQSVSEQMLQNVALDKDVMEGVADAAVLGTLSGGLMGGVTGAATKRQQPPPTLTDEERGITPTEDADGTPWVDGPRGGSGAPVAGLPNPSAAPRLGYSGTPTDQMNVDSSGNAFNSESYNDYLAQQQSADRAKRQGGFTDVTPVPQGYDQEQSQDAPAPQAAPTPKQIAPQPTTKPSESMGLNPNDGPLSAAATIAVDSGASPVAAPPIDVTPAQGSQALGSIAAAANRTPVIDSEKANSRAYTLNHKEVPYQWDVVDASELVTSHTNSFGINPDFPSELQPRDRERSAYQAQVLDIENRLRPEWLGDSTLVSQGSPFVGRDDNIVESGNGRSIGIRRAYESGKADHYKQYVQDNAAEFGLDAAEVAKIDKPVLVRRNLSDLDRSEFAHEANDPETAQLSASERARIDAKKLPSRELLEVNNSGDINIANSNKFTQQFINNIGTNEANSLIAANGELSQTGQNRIASALLHDAYGSDRLTEAVTETLDSSAKNLLKVLTSKAPQISQLNEQTAQGNRSENNLAQDIATAAETYIDMVESRANIDDYLNNYDVFGDDVAPEVRSIIKDIHSNARSTSKIGASLQARIDAANRDGNPEYLGFDFGESPDVSVEVPTTDSTTPKTPNEAAPYPAINLNAPQAMQADGGKPTKIPKNKTVEQQQAQLDKIEADLAKQNAEREALEKSVLNKDGSKKWFTSAKNAEAFIDKKKINRTHTVVPTKVKGITRYEIHSKRGDDPKPQPQSQQPKKELTVGSAVKAPNDNEYKITDIEFNDAGGVESVSTQFIPSQDSHLAGKQFNPEKRSIADFVRMFGNSDKTGEIVAPFMDQQDATTTSKTPAKEKTKTKEYKVFGVAKSRPKAEQDSLTVESGDTEWRNSYSDTKVVIRNLVAKGYLEKSEFDNSGKTHSALIELAIKGINAERAAKGLEPKYVNSYEQKEVANIQTPKAATSESKASEPIADSIKKNEQEISDLYSTLDDVIAAGDMERAREINKEINSKSQEISDLRAQAVNERPTANLDDNKDAASEKTDSATEVSGTEPTNKADSTATEDKFANNKIFTSDAVAKAKARIKSKMGTLNSGIDPELLVDGMTIAGAYVESGVRKFGDYASAMIEDFGSDIIPYLRSFYDGIRSYPGLDTEGMSSAAEAEAEHKKLLLDYQPSSAIKEMLGEDKTHAKPKRKVTKPTNKEVMLRQDWGVDFIDAWAESDEFAGVETDNGIEGGVKDQFLKNTKAYLTATKKDLEDMGYTMALDQKGKPMKVNTNKGGPASSGEVSLSMQKDGKQVYVTISHSVISARSFFRDSDSSTPAPKPHPQGIAVMYRVASGSDSSASKGTNTWLSTNLTASELATEINTAADKLKKPIDLSTDDYDTALKRNTKSRTDEFKTKEELSKENNDDGRSSTQNNSPSNQGNLPQAIRPTTESRNAGTASDSSVADLGAVDGRRSGQDAVSTNDGQSNGESKQPSNDGSRSQSSGATTSNGSGGVTTRSRGTLANHKIDASDLVRQGTWYDTAANNVAAIELIQTIDAEQRAATPAEQQQLALYTGWGASEVANGIFPNPTTGKYKSDRWQALGEKLQGLLSKSEYETARSTTQFAHYTPPVVVNAIYSALEQFGFKGGQVIEPASGVGVFNGLMPDHLATASRYTGIELDPTSGRIAQLLYPQSNMLIGDYTKTKLPNESFDVAVGNPPFANISVLSDKQYAKHKFQLHDYFFAKTIDKVKPGGVLVFVTSTGTMDKNNDKARNYLSERADLIGAVRLPQSAFKENSGTEAVTDIIFLRKRLPNEKPSDTAWTNTVEIDANGFTHSINEYYANNPDMVLGENTSRSSNFGEKYTVTPRAGDFGKQLNDAIAKMPSNVFNPQSSNATDSTKAIEAEFSIKSAEQKEGGIYLKDGKLMRVTDGVGVPLTARKNLKGTLTDLTPKQVVWLTDYVGLRDALKAAQRDQLVNSPNWEQSLAKLNKVYDAFVAKHGRILRHTVTENIKDDGSTSITRRFANKSLLFVDTEGSLVRALENVTDDVTKDGQGVIVKASFLKGRSLNPPKKATISSTQDALEVSLNENGTLDIDRIAELIGKPKTEVVEDLEGQVFLDPATGSHQLAEDYLSGNVVEKLEKAEAALKRNPDMKRNIAALKAVQPEPIASVDIIANMGANWIPASTIQQFTNEVLGAKFKISYLESSGLWTVGGWGGGREWRTDARDTSKLVEAILNKKKISITYKNADGQSVVNTIATEEANNVANNIRQAFNDWIWVDDTRAAELTDHYNRNYNNIVPAYYGDGEHLTLDGLSAKIQLRPHQKRGIYRVIRQGDVYLNHAVGAGKTFTMIASAMEEKRLGLINKPMFVVPNHMLDQFSQEFLMLYPAANIMVADSSGNFHSTFRRDFMSEAALNNPDAIIITHSSFELIGVSPTVEAEFLERSLEEWRASLTEMAEGDTDGRTVKNLEEAISKAEQKLSSLLESKDKDNNIYFEDMGIDRLYVDEAHEFRKLSFSTNMGNVKGITAQGSQKAMDLHMKIGVLRQRNPNRAIVGASGTPVTNTMGELFTVQRYFQPDQLKQDHLQHFDAWASQFGEVVDGLEQDSAGNYKMESRFAKFINVPELMSRVRSFMDILTSSDLGSLVQRPLIKGGAREIVVTPVPDGFKEYQTKLAERIEAIKQRGGKPQKGDDIILSVIGDGRFAAIDMRFIDPDLPSDPNSKLNIAIDEMAKAYQDTSKNVYHTNGVNDDLTGSAIMLFTDIGLGEQSAESRGFDMKAWIQSELIAKGVDPNHIAFMRDYKTSTQKGKLFEDMRSGSKRILIGGKNMETGVNVQKRLSHLFHLDAPWFPASVEQREGRIIRQGNQNSEVVVKGFATKGSYDSTMWSMVARKARFIEQAMSGDTSVRSMDDVSEASNFEMAAALSSGDQRYMELAGLRQDVEKLTRLETAFYRRRDKDQALLRRLNSHLKSAQAELIATQAALKNYTPLTAEVFTAKIGIVSHTKTKEFGQKLAALYTKMNNEQFVGEKQIANVGGYPIVYTGVKKGDKYFSEANVDVPSKDDTNLIDDGTIADVRTDGIASRVMNRINNMPKYVEQLQKTIKEAGEQIPLVEKSLSQSFGQEEELMIARAKLDDLEAELAAEAEAIAKPDNEEAPKFSRQGVKGATKTTKQQVIDKLSEKFGKPVIDKLIRDGVLEIKTLNDYVVNGKLTIPSDVDGLYHNNKAILIADNLSDDMIVPTFLHELGGHGGFQTLMSDKAYAALMKDFDALVASGDPLAVRAKAMAERVSSNQNEANDEYLPYLITLASRKASKQGKLAKLMNRIIMAVRGFLRNKLGINLKLNAADIVQLAERMVVQRAVDGTQNAILNKEINNVKNQYQGTAEWLKAPNGKPTNLNEQQWLQVRTPAFKKWFGDWENDPTNASKVLDENGEPLVLYHGAKNEFWAFDMNRSVPQRNEGMMGMFFADNAKTAAGYTVNLPKEAAVVKAKVNHTKTSMVFNFKRQRLESENRTGDEIQDLTKKEFEAMKAAEAEFKAAVADAFNNAYDNAESRTKAVFIRSLMPFEQDGEGKSFSGVNKKAAERYFVDGFYDGIINSNVLDDANANHSVGSAKVVISFDATNIKSATDNVGTFDPNNDDIRYGRRRRYNDPNQLSFDFDAIEVASTELTKGAPANQPELAATVRDEAEREAWRKKHAVNQRQQRTPSVQDAAKRYQEGEITQDEYIEIVRRDMPIVPMGKVPDVPSLLEVGFALDKNKVETGIVGIDKVIDDDTRVGLRLDIPAYDNYDTWIVSIHDGEKAGGKSLGYAQTGYIKDVEFMTAPKGALNIATGKANKSTIARMHGDWINHSPYELAEKAKEALRSPDWLEVGMNPFRHSWFYDKADGNPVVSADEVIQIGALVLARNAQKTTVDDDQFTAGKGSGMKFSRSANLDDDFDIVDFSKQAGRRFWDWASAAPAGKLSWWHKTVGTMYNLAQRNPYFKPVYENTEKFINDVSFYAAKASEFAPRLLPKLDGLRDITKSAISTKDNEAISKPIFEGTLIWGRDLDGNAVKVDDWLASQTAQPLQSRVNTLRNAGRFNAQQQARFDRLPSGIRQNAYINNLLKAAVPAGVVWTDSELRQNFNLNDNQIELYREFRATTDSSLDNMARADMLRRLGKEANNIEKEVMEAADLNAATSLIARHIQTMILQDPQKADALNSIMEQVQEAADKTHALMQNGYAPLSRFGQYTVDVVDADGNREYFGLFESAYEARKMAESMRSAYDDSFKVSQGALSNEEFKMFAGITPETAELFGEMLGLNGTGGRAADKAFQSYLKHTKNNRSALKRLIHRKGIKGFSEDSTRVLASFVYSNARHTSAALNMGNMDRAIEAIPKGEGQLKDAAVRLAEYIKNPQDEGYLIRSFMFAQYLGGSIASALVNLTQPIAVSFPYLSQFGGAGKSANELRRASADWASAFANKNRNVFSADLQRAIKEAEDDGILSPQEVHNLLRQARGKNPLRSGDGTAFGDSVALAQNTASRLGLAWGSFFSLAEQANRRITFVAAYRMAVDQGMENPANFARESIKETQFVYNKAARMQWGRGAVGGTLMTFKTYTVSYIELIHRLWTQGEKGSPERAQGRKAALVMLATLFVLSGMGGVPFMEDAEDLIDGAAQVMGYNISSKQHRQAFLDSVFGEMFGEFMESGISGINGAPIDVSGRLGLGNLIPATGLLKERPSNLRDALEVIGPAGDFVSRVGEGTRGVLKGAIAGDARTIGRSTLSFMPVAVRNAAIGTDMLNSGMYKDKKGYKVDDVSAIDAAFKFFGFQPNHIAKLQDRTWTARSLADYYNLRAADIRSLWAQGIVEKNPNKIRDAQAALKVWNKNNPTQRIIIRPTDIQRRVREMKMGKEDRVLKHTPKNMREHVRAEFAAATTD